MLHEKGNRLTVPGNDKHYSGFCKLWDEPHVPTFSQRGSASHLLHYDIQHEVKCWDWGFPHPSHYPEDYVN
jgi:hypothetical protein